MASSLHKTMRAVTCDTILQKYIFNSFPVAMILACQGVVCGRTCALLTYCDWIYNMVELVSDDSVAGLTGDLSDAVCVMHGRVFRSGSSLQSPWVLAGRCWY